MSKHISCPTPFNWPIISFSLLFLSTAAAYAPCIHAKPTDAAIRINQNINATVNQFMSLHAWMLEHMDESMSNFNYFETGIGPRIRFNSKFAVSLFYRQSFSEQTQKEWHMEKAPSANVEFSLPLQWIQFWNQTRFEYRNTYEWKNLRIKNYLKISVSNRSYTPYSAWESFYENEFTSFKLHRFFWGIAFPVSKGIAVDYYVRFDVLTENRLDLFRICVGLKIIFSFSL